MAKFTGPELLKTILQLIRYDIPPLIVGKSSIGKSYTIIELTKKWRLPNDVLYIGSEKPENIEGLAKLIDAKYNDQGQEDILKFLKPYWFPNNTTISQQVKNGRDIFNEFGGNWTNKSVKFDYTYNCMYLILMALMEVKFPEDQDTISVKLVDSGTSYISNSETPQILNDEPFEFKRTPITREQAETNVEASLPPSEAGRDDIRDLCMYVCTVLGFGNYWLILDEIDKVDKYSQDKYAPLLHIVRERTLKNWTIQPINDKEGLDIPFSATNGYYKDIADNIDRQIEAGLPLLDTRILGIGNASKEIEEALFRRFVQIIMQDTMAIYPADEKASKIKSCVNENFEDANLLDMSLLKKIGFLDDVNLAWQYSILPKIFNQNDKGNNYFHKDFMRWYQKFSQKYRNEREREKLMKSGDVFFNETAIGFLFDSCFTGGGKVGGNADLLEKFKKFLYCLIQDEWLIEGSVKANKIGSVSPEGIEESEIEIKRSLLLKKFEEEGEELFFNGLTDDIRKGFKKVIDKEGVNIGGLRKWVQRTMFNVIASNSTEKELNQLPEIGSKMTPFIYGEIIRNLTNEKKIDTDLFNKLLEEMYSQFTILFSKGEVKSLDTDDEMITELFKSDYFGKPLFSNPEKFDGYDLEVYMNKYFKNEFQLFLKYNLSAKGFPKLIQKSGSKRPYFDTEASQIENFFAIPRVKDYLQKFYDRNKQKFGDKLPLNFKNLAKFADLTP